MLAKAYKWDFIIAQYYFCINIKPVLLFIKGGLQIDFTGIVFLVVEILRNGKSGFFQLIFMFVQPIYKIAEHLSLFFSRICSNSEKGRTVVDKTSGLQIIDGPLFLLYIPGNFKECIA